MAVAHDISAEVYDASLAGTNDYAAALNVGAGANRVLVVSFTFSDPTHTISGVTWDQGGTNQAMTLIGTTNAVGGTGRIDWYGLVAPTSGSKTLRLAMSGLGGEVFIGLSAYTGADQTGGATTFAHFNSATGNSTTTSVAITSASGNVTVVTASGPQVMSAPTQTQIYVDNAGSVTSAAMSRANGAASVTHQWTLAGAVQWVTSGVDIVQTGGGGGAAAASTLMLMGMGP